MSELFEKFSEDYAQKYDFFEKLCREVRSICQAELQRQGIKAIVSCRAKDVESAKSKAISREFDKHYSTVSEIYADLRDLSGVRIALYFPSQIEEVTEILKTRFDIVETKTFPVPTDTSKVTSSYSNIFSGYNATHFRVRMLEADVEKTGIRFQNAITEIQIASVLMHAWSEVGHDLTYKELNGEVSLAESEVLDQLNGLVMAGEISLKRLFRVIQERIQRERRPFKDSYELAAFLKDKFSSVIGGEKQLGNVERLFKFLQAENLTGFEIIKPLIATVLSDKGTSSYGSISEILLEEAAKRYPGIHFKLSEEKSKGDTLEFLREFAGLNSQLFKIASATRTVIQELVKRKLITTEELEAYQRARELRAKLVHSTDQTVDLKVPSELISILKQLSATLHDKVDEIWDLEALRIRKKIRLMENRLNGDTENGGTVKLWVETDKTTRCFMIRGEGDIYFGEDPNDEPALVPLVFQHTGWHQSALDAWKEAKEILEKEDPSFYPDDFDLEVDTE